MHVMHDIDIFGHFDIMNHALRLISSLSVAWDSRQGAKLGMPTGISKTGHHKVFANKLL